MAHSAGPRKKSATRPTAGKSANQYGPLPAMGRGRAKVARVTAATGRSSYSALFRALAPDTRSSTRRRRDGLLILSRSRAPNTRSSTRWRRHGLLILVPPPGAGHDV